MPIGIVVAILLLVAPPAWAQGTSVAFDELRSRLKPGDTVYVAETDGRLTRGKLGELSASTLELLVPAQGVGGGQPSTSRRLLSKDDIREIDLERHDSVMNGMLIGLGVGAGIGALGGADRCSGDICGSTKGATIAGTTAMFAAIGAGMGIWIDWGRSSVERTRVYVAPAPESSSRRQPAAFHGPTAVMQMSFRF